MTRYTATEARKYFAELINEAAYGGKRIVVTRHNKDIAALVPFSDVEMLLELEKILDVVTLPALKRQLGLTKKGRLNR